jgi:outer membrane lipoprotein SlyB
MRLKSNILFIKNSLAILIGLMALSGCAPKLGGNDYGVSGAGEISKTRKGVIVATRSVILRPDNSHEAGTGAAAGAIGGAALGSTIGGGDTMPIVSAVIGGIAGGAAGHAIEGKLTEQEGTEYHIKLANGTTITIAQGVEPRMSVGQKVLVIESKRSRSRVVPDNTGY